MIAYLGLGANLGDPFQTLNQLAPLLPGAELSCLYVTEPVGGPPGQPMYLNAACRISWAGSPFALLDWCLETEARFGRVRGARNGPRIIDIDIVYIESVSIHSKELEVPHPRAREREFVLQPLGDLAPELARALRGGGTTPGSGNPVVYAMPEGAGWRRLG